ncbi:MAG: lysophospholipid acyltransferase family protein [Tannerella sp.]|jgi:putative hemolysin|nr:lysophospholipid acyltransferase family protein [Tannerella sp.]
MRKTVFDIEDLQEISPFFRNKFTAFLGKLLIKWLEFSKINKIHSDHCHLRGAEFTSAMLSDPIMDVKYNLFNTELLDSLPEGAFITVSNHPIGSLDGIILIDIFASYRKDFKVMVNEMLDKVGALADNFISVKPNTDDERKGNISNTGGVREALSWLKGGHPIGFFPAGAMSFKNSKDEVLDRPWTHSVIRLIRKANVTVYPVYFGCRNSNLFYWLGKISWKIRTLRVAAETFNKRGQTFAIHLRPPITAKTLKQFTDDTELAEFLYKATYDTL